MEKKNMKHFNNYKHFYSLQANLQTNGQNISRINAQKSEESLQKNKQASVYFFCSLTDRLTEKIFIELILIDQINHTPILNRSLEIYINQRTKYVQNRCLMKGIFTKEIRSHIASRNLRFPHTISYGRKFLFIKQLRY